MTEPVELSPRPRLTIRRPLRSYGQFDSFMDSFSFFENLPSHVRHEFLERSISRRFGRGDQLRGINSTGAMVHLILHGAVRERITYAFSPHASTVRFFGRGAIIGVSDIFLDEPQPSVVECLHETWTLAYPLDRIRMLAEGEAGLMRNLAQALATQLKANDRVYSLCRKSSAQRVASLLIELFEINGEDSRTWPDSNGDWHSCPVVVGPSQVDIADALMLSMASVENVLRGLRRIDILATEYRQFVFLDMQRLKEVATGDLTIDTTPKKK